MLQYLNSACGKPVLCIYPRDDHSIQVAVGLEHLAEMFEDVETLTISTKPPTIILKLGSCSYQYLVL